MKASPRYRMKNTFLTLQELEIGKTYVSAPNGQTCFTVIEKKEDGVTVNYPKRKAAYATQFKTWGGEKCAFDGSTALYKLKAI